MQKVMIADDNEDFSLILAGALRSKFWVETCPDGTRALERLRAERPDVLILDLMIPGMSGMDLLRAVRTEGLCAVVMVTSRFFSDYVMDALQRYQVDYVARKPCTIQSVVDRLEDMVTDTGATVPTAPDPENLLTSMLLALNMQTHRKGFRYCRMGILMCANDPGLQVTKEVYPVIAKEVGSTGLAVEKAIRGAIEDAWDNRNDSLWRQYFPPASNGMIPKPTNTQFLFRLADALEMGQHRMARR